MERETQAEALTVVFISVQEVQVFCILVFAGAVAGAFQCLFERGYQSFWHFVGVCGTSGFLGVTGVAIATALLPDRFNSGLYLLVISGSFGALGKWANSIREEFLGKLLGRKIKIDGNQEDDK